MTTTERAVPADLEMEACALGAMLNSTPSLVQLVQELDASDFHRPAHATAFAAMVRLYSEGHAVNEKTLASELRKRGGLDSIGGPAGIVDLLSNVPSSSITSAKTYAAAIREHASQRRLLAAANEVVESAYKLADPTEIADGLLEALSKLDRGGSLPERYWRSTSEYLAADKGESAIALIEGVLPGLSRSLVLASEKAGKSLCLRQFGECAGAGIHPFTFRPIEPIRVLIMDAENDDDELERTLPVIKAVIDGRLGKEHPEPALFSSPYGVDLMARRDISELHAVLDDFRPQLIIGGPIYKLIDESRHTSEDARAAALQRIFDDIRRRYGCALILEHHAPTGRDGQREIRSKGGQKWDAWVNATIALYARNGGQAVSVKYVHPPRGNIRWPKGFERSARPGDFPWMPVWNPAMLGRPSTQEALEEVRADAAEERLDEPDDETYDQETIW